MQTDRHHHSISECACTALRRSPPRAHCNRTDVIDVDHDTSCPCDGLESLDREHAQLDAIANRLVDTIRHQEAQLAKLRSKVEQMATDVAEFELNEAKSHRDRAHLRNKAKMREVRVLWEKSEELKREIRSETFILKKLRFLRHWGETKVLYRRRATAFYQPSLERGQ